MIIKLIVSLSQFIPQRGKWSAVNNSVAKAETVYLPVRTKCATFITTPLGVVVWCA